MKLSNPVPCALALAALQLAPGPAASAAPDGSTWRLREPIVWYFAGPGYFNDVNDTTVAPLVAGGWNLGWAYSRSELDVYHRHGMQALAAIGNPDMADPAQTKAIDEKLAWADHPATYGYWICDEPAPSAFANIAKVVAYLRRHDPARPTVVNLLPILSTADGDLATPYRATLRQFVETVKPDVLCYDFYPFMAKGDALFYFLNLMLIREEALRAGIPFINITQAIAHENLGYRWPTEHEMRWLSYTTLAYGGQGISWYIYNDRADVPALSGFFEDTPDCRVPKPNYWAVSRTNRDFAAIATELMKLPSRAVYHVGPPQVCGDSTDARWTFLKNDPNEAGNPYWARTVEPHLPLGGVPLPADSRFQVEPTAVPADLLLGCFGTSARRPSHVLVANLDYRNPVTTTLCGPGTLAVFHAPTRTWTRSPLGSRAKLDLPPGGGLLVRVEK